MMTVNKYVFLKILVRSPVNQFIPLNRKAMCAREGVLGFDLYHISIESSLFEPVPLCESGTAISLVQDRLREFPFDKMYVRQEEVGKYYSCMEHSLESVLDDPEVDVEGKSAMIYSCASNVMEDVFRDPRSGANLDRAKKITDNIIKFSLNDTQSISHLLSLSSHDYYTFTHCVNVAVFAVGLFQFIGRGTDADLHALALGAILHDVGKTKIDDAILNKPGRLTDEEFAIMQTHSRLGYDLMKGKLGVGPLDVILHHHERFDGTGYPEKLKADAISDNAKVSTIADVYDALTTIRPYSDARKPFEALVLMKEKMVGHFAQKSFLSFIQFLSGGSS